MIAELSQLQRKNVFIPVDIRRLNHDQRSKILRTLMFLKKKRDGRLKARACVDGSPQKSRFDTETDPSSPTVSLEALMLTCVADAVEGRTVVTADIEGAYLEVHMKDEVYVELDHVLAQLMVQIEPSYKEFMVPKKNGKGYKLVMKLNKALYGCVQSARLFYEHLSKTLIDFGFVANEYDQCVLNKMINGYQCTVVLYVDDLKISCVSKEAVEEVVKHLEKTYTKININRGEVHTYLGMELDYREKGFVRVTMREMVAEAIDMFGESINGTVTTPAAQYLFNVQADAEKLTGGQAELFHSIVAKLLYIAKRARPDILTCVCFLATRVRESNVDDWKKLKRVLTYLSGTRELGLRLSAGDMTLVEAYADASYAVHSDTKSHSGTVITFGEGAIYTKSTKQKIVTKSSTEAELVGLSDSLAQVLWTRYFLQSQGYDVGAVKVYQDNKSAILLAENGKMSSGQRTRHINIRYFFVKDRIDSGEIRVEHMPTEDMLADFFTKPLQGALFIKMRDAIMNPGGGLTTISSQERVGAGAQGR
jgi:hypothetical protein